MSETPCSRDTCTAVYCVLSNTWPPQNPMATRETNAVTNIAVSPRLTCVVASICREKSVCVCVGGGAGGWGTILPHLFYTLLTLQTGKPDTSVGNFTYSCVCLFLVMMKVHRQELP